MPTCAPLRRSSAGGACWSELLGGFAYYHGRGESEVLLISPSGADLRQKWTINKVPFTGTAAPDPMWLAGAHCKRFLEHKDAGGFLWLGDAKAPAKKRVAKKTVKKPKKKRRSVEKTEPRRPLP